MFFSIQMALIPSNADNLQSTPSNQVLFNSNHLDTLKCVQLAFNTFKSNPLQVK